MPRLATAGQELHYEDAGRGTPVVLVHGWSLSSAAFGGQIELLSRSSRVVAPDLRGHGRSAGGASFCLDDLARDLSDLAGSLALEGAVLVGWSLGAHVALAALPLLGQRVSALVLVSGTPRFTLAKGWPHGLEARSIRVLARSVGRDVARAAARFFDGMFVEGELDGEGRRRAERVRAAVPPPDAAAALSGLEILEREDLRPLLERIDVPTLVVHGEADPICPVGAARAMASAIPNARLAMIRGAGHAPFLSRAGAFRDALGSFLAEAA